MPLWGSGSNHIPFTANATNGSTRLTNVAIGTGFTATDFELGQLVVGVGTTGVPYESHIRDIGNGSTYIELTNPFIAATGSNLVFESVDSYKPIASNPGNKAFEPVDIFATQSGWVQRRYKRRIQFTGNISTGSSLITNLANIAGAGSTVDLQLGMLVGAVGVIADPNDRKGNYITRIGSGFTTITLKNPAVATASGVAIDAYSYWDEPIIAARELAMRLSDPEITSVSFDKNRYTVNAIGFVVVSFNEPVNVGATNSQITVTNSGSGSTVATYFSGSGTNKLLYRFTVGTAGSLSITNASSITQTLTGIDKNNRVVSFTGTRTAGSRSIVGIASTSIDLLKPGQSVVGTGITASTTITGVGTTSITISSSALASGTTVLTTNEADARGAIYASYQIGAGLTSTGIQGYNPIYRGTGTSEISSSGGTFVTAVVA